MEDDTTLPSAALRDFSPVFVRFGSSATDAVEAALRFMSALLRKRTCVSLPRYVRFVPIADILIIPAFQLSSGLPKAAPPAPDFGRAENFAGVKSLPLARASRAVPKLQLLFLCHPFERKQPQETYASAPILQTRDGLFLQILLPPQIAPPIHMLRRRRSELCRSADLRLLTGSLS